MPLLDRERSAIQRTWYRSLILSHNKTIFHKALPSSTILHSNRIKARASSIVAREANKRLACSRITSFKQLPLTSKRLLKRQQSYKPCLLSRRLRTRYSINSWLRIKRSLAGQTVRRLQALFRFRKHPLRTPSSSILIKSSSKPQGSSSNSRYRKASRYDRNRRFCTQQRWPLQHIISIHSCQSSTIPISAQKWAHSKVKKRLLSQLEASK